MLLPCVYHALLRAFGICWFGPPTQPISKVKEKGHLSWQGIYNSDNSRIQWYEICSTLCTWGTNRQSGCILLENTPFMAVVTSQRHTIRHNPRRGVNLTGGYPLQAWPHLYFPTPLIGEKSPKLGVFDTHDLYVTSGSENYHFSICPYEMIITKLHILLFPNYRTLHMRLVCVQKMNPKLKLRAAGYRCDLFLKPSLSLLIINLTRYWNSMKGNKPLQEACT